MSQKYVFLSSAVVVLMNFQIDFVEQKIAGWILSNLNSKLNFHYIIDCVTNWSLIWSELIVWLVLKFLMLNNSQFASLFHLCRNLNYIFAVTKFLCFVNLAINIFKQKLLIHFEKEKKKTAHTYPKSFNFQYWTIQWAILK